MARLEKSIEDSVVQWARREYGELVTKMNQVGSKGFPDRIFWMEGGYPLLLEFKRPQGVLSEMQVFRYGQLRKMGYEVEVADDVEYAKDLIISARAMRGLKT